MRQLSPGLHIDTEHGSELPTLQPELYEHTATQHSALKPIEEGSIKFISSAAKGNSNRSGVVGRKRQVSFDASHTDLSALSPGGHAVRQL